MVELIRALATLGEPPGAETPAIVEALGLPAPPDLADYTDFFVFQQVPFASVYLSFEGMVGGDAGDRIAGFWRALGGTPPAEPDHLATLLAAYADLSAAMHSDAGELARRGAASHALLWEHILSWMPVFLTSAVRAHGPYAPWARLLLEALLEEARTSPVEPVMPIHLRDLTPLGQPSRGESDAFIAALLAPVRSGIILTRRDLARASHATGLGIPPGERRSMLRSLFDQDARLTAGWLADEAAWWERRHAEVEPELGPVAQFWRRQAAATAMLLGS